MTGYVIGNTVVGTEGPIIAPAGLSSPAFACTGCAVTGGTLRRLTEATTGQEVLLVMSEADEAAVRYGFSGPPERFAPKRIRHLLPAL